MREILIYPYKTYVHNRASVLKANQKLHKSGNKHFRNVKLFKLIYTSH